MAPRTLTPDDLAELRSIVAEYFARVDPGAEMDEWEIRLSDGTMVGLVNAFGVASDVPRERWREFLFWHFDTLRSIDPLAVAPFDDAVANLRVRLADDVGVGAHHSDSVRRICEGLSEVLMVRFEGGCRTLPPTAWECWDAERDAVWREARKRTLWDEPWERRQLERDGLEMGWITASFYASSLLLDLGRFLAPEHRHGALATVPTVYNLLWVPLDRRFGEATAAMVELAGKWWSEGPNSISPEVFWWTESGISRVVAAKGTRLRPCWGEDFSKALAEIEAGS